jgi:hypothetical protein
VDELRVLWYVAVVRLFVFVFVDVFFLCVSLVDVEKCGVLAIG